MITRHLFITYLRVPFSTLTLQTRWCQAALITYTQVRFSNKNLLQILLAVRHRVSSSSPRLIRHVFNQHSHIFPAVQRLSAFLMESFLCFLVADMTPIKSGEQKHWIKCEHVPRQLLTGNLRKTFVDCLKL